MQPDNYQPEDDDKMRELPERKRRRGIYLLPNLFTTANLFAGFYAVVAAMQDRFEAAAIAIFIAMVLDGIDGRVARLTNTQSDFGAEYDSMVDMVSFGLAPALVMYQWALSSLGKVGWLGAFIFTAGAALRLARFNTQLGHPDKRYFQGLPSPSAAGLIAGLIWFGADLDVTGADLAWLAFLITVLAGVLMVSNVRFRSFKDLDLKNRVPFVAVFVIVLIYVFISINPPLILFSGFAIYALSGPMLTLYHLRQKKASAASEDDQSPPPPA